LDEWDKVRSTKVDTLVTLLGWHLESDNNAAFSMEDPTASMHDPTLMDQSGGDAPQQCGANNTVTRKVNMRYVEMPGLMTMGTRKILVYMEFPMMAPLLVSVLKLYNIVPLIIHGGHGVEERNETVQKFNSDPTTRILIFSNVGAVGLNLTAASIVILFVSLTHVV
jgi:SNF2 family DNA or RNA helicase